MKKCGVCRSDPARLAAIDKALLDERTSLQNIARVYGFSKSSLHRHKAHLSQPVTMATVPVTTLALVPPGAPPVAEVQTARLLDVKTQILERLELLWREALEGLNISKEPIHVTRPDGSKAEIPGDLRARSAFIREARSVVESQGSVSGVLTSAPAIAVQIVLPAFGSGSPAPFESEPDETLTMDIRQSRR